MAVESIRHQLIERAAKQAVILCAFLISLILILGILAKDEITMHSATLVQQYLLNKALYAAQKTNINALEQLNQTHTHDHPLYQHIISPHREILTIHSSLAYIYTMQLHEGKVRFFTDISTRSDKEKATIFEEYSDATQEMLLALHQGVAIVEQKAHSDKWGTFISGYAPLKREDGSLFGIVGVDMDVNVYMSNFSAIQQFLTGLILLAILISIIFSSVFYRFRLATLWKLEKQKKIAANSKSLLKICQRPWQFWTKIFAI